MDTTGVNYGGGYGTHAMERLLISKFDGQAHNEIIADINKANATELKATSDSEGRLNVQGALNASALGVAQAKGFGDLNVQGALNTAQLGLQTSTVGTAVAVGQKDTLIAIEQAKFANAEVTRNEAEKTRELINSLAMQNIQRELATAQNKVIELMGDKNGRSHADGVTQIVNQNQQQQQQQGWFADLRSQLHALQVAQATNTALNFGPGVVTQAANPTNVRV